MLELDVVREKPAKTLEFIDRLHPTDSTRAYKQ